MRGLAYVSNAVCEFDREALHELSEHAKEKNARIEITGYLYFERNRFLQYIEGNRATVDELMAAIDRDERHDVLGTIVDDDLVERRFPNWTMGIVQPSGVPRVEATLVEHVRLMVSAAAPDAAWERTAWRLVDEIAHLQVLVPNLFH